jgi:phage head maturation protease
VPLLDTSYNRDLLPGLKDGVYGASFRFQVMKEELKQDPGVSDHNPKGLPERTITEARVMEFGPVTFPAYAGATPASEPHRRVPVTAHHSGRTAEFEAGAGR